MTNFSKGIISTSLGSLWWGILGVLYFRYISFAGHIEVVAHRCIWTALILFITTSYFKKWYLVLEIFNNKKKLFLLFITGLLILTNWTVWIYAVSINKIIDASFGYFVFPILNVFFGYIFFKEELNKRRIFSIILVIFSILYMLYSFNSFPWIGLSVALSWSIYNLIRKKINVETEVGLFIESLFILPIAIICFYFIYQNNVNDFNLSNPSLMIILFLAGPMTLIPLFLHVRGVELSGLGPSGMIFFITPSCQFLLGFFYYNEPFTLNKFLSFILIWIAVSIYIRDLYEKN